MPFRYRACDTPSQCLGFPKWLLWTVVILFAVGVIFGVVALAASGWDWPTAGLMLGAVALLIVVAKELRRRRTA